MKTLSGHKLHQISHVCCSFKVNRTYLWQCTALCTVIAVSQDVHPYQVPSKVILSHSISPERHNMHWTHPQSRTLIIEVNLAITITEDRFEQRCDDVQARTMGIYAAQCMFNDAVPEEALLTGMHFELFTHATRFCGKKAGAPPLLYKWRCMACKLALIAQLILLRSAFQLEAAVLKPIQVGAACWQQCKDSCEWRGPGGAAGAVQRAATGRGAR